MSLYLIELHQPARRRPTVIETARTEGGAKRMARTLARLRFGTPEFIADKTAKAGGHWVERAEDGATAGEQIHITGGTDG